MNVELDSPFSVSNEDSTGLKSPYDHKADVEVEGVDLNVMFEVDCAPLGEAPGPSL